MTNDPQFDSDPILSDDVVGPPLRQMLKEGAPLPNDLNEHVLKQLQSEPSVSTTVAPTRKRLPMFMKYGLAASILAITASAIGFLGNFGGQSDVYADVAERLQKMRAMMFRVQFVEERELDMIDAEEGHQVTYIAPSLHRIEHGNDQVHIIDSAQNKLVMLTHSRKEALVMTGDAVKKMVAMSNVQLVETLQRHFSKNRNDDSLEKLGSRDIDGNEATGLRSRMGGQVVEVWVQPQTHRLVEARLKLNLPPQMTGGKTVNIWHVMTDFRFDSEVAHDTFSAEVPDDYVLIEMPDIQQLATRPAELNDLLLVLRLCATHNDGVFPRSLSPNDDEGTPMGNHEAVHKQDGRTASKHVEAGTRRHNEENDGVRHWYWTNHNVSFDH